MPIVISEFEIVPEPSPSPAGPAPAAPPSQPENRLPTPHELALAVAHESRRLARVKAE